MSDLETLFVAWQSPRTRSIHPVGRLSCHEGAYEFVYVAGVEDAVADGFVLFARMKERRRRYTSRALFPLFSNRLMPDSRAGYNDYLERLGLSDSPAEPLVVLARSEGRKPTDNLELFGFPSFDSRSRSWIHLLFARGVRHIQGAEDAIAQLGAGDALLVERDPQNRVDGRALKLVASGGGGVSAAVVGFIPATLLDDLELLTSRGSSVSAQTVRVNSPPAPVHQRLLVRLAIDDQPDYSPFESRRYQPLAPDAARLTVPDR